MSMPAAPLKLCDYPLRSIEKLRYADTDCQGHISNAVFAVCCQNARMEVMCDPSRVPIPPQTQFAIAKLVLEFRAEMHWPGAVEVGTRVTRVGRSSVVLAQALFVGDRCVAVADSTVVLMDRMSRRSTPLPPEAIRALNGLVGRKQVGLSRLAELRPRALTIRAAAKRAMKFVGLGW